MEKDAGVVTIPVLRLRGTYGRVSVDFSTSGSAAGPGAHVLHGSSLTFQHGQNLSFINVSIIDSNARLVIAETVGTSQAWVLWANLHPHLSLTITFSTRNNTRDWGVPGKGVAPWLYPSFCLR